MIFLEKWKSIQWRKDNSTEEKEIDLDVDIDIDKHFSDNF